MSYSRKKRTSPLGRKRKPVSGSKTPFVATRALANTRRQSDRKITGTDLSEDRLPTLEELECDYIQKVLHHVSDNKTRAAKILGINRVSLWRKIKSMELLQPAVWSEEL